MFDQTAETGSVYCWNSDIDFNSSCVESDVALWIAVRNALACETDIKLFLKKNHN